MIVFWFSDGYIAACWIRSCLGVYDWRLNQSLKDMASRRLILAIFVSFLAYTVYREPVPEGTTEPLLQKLIFSAYKLTWALGGWCETLGISSAVGARRFLLDKGAGLFDSGFLGVETQDADFDGIKVRLFIPYGVPENAPGVVFYHGGGWCIGSIDSHAAVTGFIAKELNAVVVSVDYRLSPEYRQWQGLEDSVKATKYFIENAANYGVDSTNIALAGDSAGGNMAAGVALKLRDAGVDPQPKLQVLIYPSVQSIDLELPSYQQNSAGPLLIVDHVMWFKSNTIVGDDSLVKQFTEHTYVPRDVRDAMARGRVSHDIIPPGQRYPPYKRPEFDGVDMAAWAKVKDTVLGSDFSPLMAEHHRGLPEAYILTCQFDPLRDEGYLYAHRLREDGTAVTHYNEKAGYHGMINNVKVSAESKQVMNQVVSFMRSKML